MSSNVDYTICPKCDAVNAATWSPRGKRSYDVTCSVCGWEYEHGHYDSARNLTFERFLNEAIQTTRIEDVDTSHPFYLAERGDIMPWEVEDYMGKDQEVEE